MASWRAGGKKLLPTEQFLTTDDSLLICEQATALRNKCYKPSDRSEVARAFEKKRGLRSKNEPLGESVAAGKM